MAGKVILYDFEVSCSGYPTVTVSNIGPDSASLQAATERWGLTRRDWAEVAWDIRVKKLGVTLKPRCRRCGREIEALNAREQGTKTGAEPGARAPNGRGRVTAQTYGLGPVAEGVKRESVPGLCPDCAAAEAQYRREMAKIRRPDRRVADREQT